MYPTGIKPITNQSSILACLLSSVLTSAFKVSAVISVRLQLRVAVVVVVVLSLTLSSIFAQKDPPEEGVSPVVFFDRVRVH